VCGILEEVAIDGCEVGCAKAILEHAEIPIKNFLVVTKLGIEKNKDFNLIAEDILKVKAASSLFVNNRPLKMMLLQVTTVPAVDKEMIW
jgi:uncharacterized metal-binding protein